MSVDRAAWAAVAIAAVLVALVRSGWWIWAAVALIVAWCLGVGYVTYRTVWRLSHHFERAAQSTLFAVGVSPFVLAGLAVAIWSGPYGGLFGQATVGLLRVAQGLEDPMVLWLVLIKVGGLATAATILPMKIASKASIL